MSSWLHGKVGKGWPGASIEWCTTEEEGPRQCAELISGLEAGEGGIELRNNWAVVLLALPKQFLL